MAATAAAHGGARRGSLPSNRTWMKILFWGLLLLQSSATGAAFWSPHGLRSRPRAAPVARAVVGGADAGAATTAPSPPTMPFIDERDVPVWPVPPAIRRSQGLGQGGPSYVKFLSLAEVFASQDGEKLADLFDTDGDFRHAIRVAMRDDLFIPDPTRSEKVNRFLKDLGSSLHVNWEKSPTGYAGLSSVFERYGIQGLSGEIFIKTLGGLAGGGARVQDANGFALHEHRFGSLIDIVTGGRVKPAHSWHQDCNLRQATVMVGFPKSNQYKGTGVFSHAIKLTHQLQDQVPGGGAVVQYDEFEGVRRQDDLSNPFPDSVVLHPWYAKGREIMVYDDSWHLHSAPNHIHRAAVWRFM